MDLVSIREDINQMAELTLSMLKSTFEGFMEHDLDILAGVLKDEQRLNDLERTITLSLIDVSKGEVSAADKKNIMVLTNIIGDLEEIGDYIKDMIERIEIKIQEKLLFSEEGLSEYKHLYGIVQDSLSDTVSSLKKDDKNAAERISSSKEDVDKLIQKYRDAHARRLISGVCDPRAGNMFLNILDFTGQISHHAEAITRKISKIKWT